MNPHTVTAAGHAERLYHTAKERWGDVPVSVETTSWESGEYQAEAFHTLGRVADGEPIRARLMYWSHDDRLVERLEHMVMGQRPETYHEVSLHD